MVSSLRVQAMIITLNGLLAVSRRWAKGAEGRVVSARRHGSHVEQATNRIQSQADRRTPTGFCQGPDSILLQQIATAKTEFYALTNAGRMSVLAKGRHFVS